MSGNFSDERPAKKRRGGKKAKKQQVLRERFERGEFVPKAFVSTGAGSSADRSAKSSSIVAFLRLLKLSSKRIRCLSLLQSNKVKPTPAFRQVLLKERQLHLSQLPSFHHQSSLV